MTATTRRPILTLMVFFWRSLLVLGVFGGACYFALQFGTGGLWRGLETAHAVTSSGRPQAPYDLTQLVAVNETLKTISEKYVDPDRVRPRQLFLSALNQIQKEVAQVIVLHKERSPKVRLRVDTEESDFRVDNIQGPWDVSARLREVFTFLQKNLANTDVKLRNVEYAACNGMLQTLDPHSVFLSPEAYREMNLSTSGHFGGLGIVIAIRDQMLTIMRPMAGTPAGRAKLKRLDRITKINNESTLNMPLEDSVKRLRGRPGSNVTIWVHRDGEDGWQKSRPFELTREQISIQSTDSRALGNGIGYVRLKQFQSGTSQELGNALTQLRSQGGLRGLVLDLRGNPGGLLDQAAKVSDRFLQSGTIVSTDGTGGRDEKPATSRGTEPLYPLVVLVNGSSASASEIVAGALRNLDRAIVVGQTTFGKGTVQLVFPRVTPEGAALKLTIAQYLTPGDISIQGVGVSPDIELDPMTADMVEMDLFRSSSALRERDLSKSLNSEAKRSSDRPSAKLRYRVALAEREQMRELGGDLEDEFQMDFPIRFAKDLVGRLRGGSRSDQLRTIPGFIEQVQRREVDLISRDLDQLGVNWVASSVPDGAGIHAGDYDVEVSSDRPRNQVNAGQPMILKVRVENHGESSIYRLRAITKSDSSYYDEKELIFGKLEPGESKRVDVALGWCRLEGRQPGSTKPLAKDAKRTCKIPSSADSRQDIVHIRFTADGGEAPKPAVFRPTVKSLERPIFAYDYQVVDNRSGNGDGQLERGEGATVYFTVKNVGRGRSYATQANLRNLTGDGLLLHAGRFDISNMEPGAVRNVAFTLDALDNLQEDVVRMEVSVVDRDLRTASSERISIPIMKRGLDIMSEQGRVRVVDDASVHGQPFSSSPVVGTLEKGAVVDAMGSLGGYTKVALGGDRFGFIVSQKKAPAQDSKASVQFTPHFSHSPPLLEVSPAQLATRNGEVRLEGQVTDTDRVLDAYIFVGLRKVFYQSNRKGNDPQKLSFALDAELQPGVNLITVVAREDENTISRHSMVVRRDGPNGEFLPTPRNELFGADWEFTSAD